MHNQFSSANEIEMLESDSDSTTSSHKLSEDLSLQQINQEESSFDRNYISDLCLQITAQHSLDIPKITKMHTDPLQNIEKAVSLTSEERSSDLQEIAYEQLDIDSSSDQDLKSESSLT